MKNQINIAESIEMFQGLKDLFPSANDRGLRTSTGWACNQPKMRLSGRLLFSPVKPILEMSESERNAYLQGFYCIELNFAVSWGGSSHDGTKLTGPRTTIHILDRRARWDGPTIELRNGEFSASEQINAKHFDTLEEIVTALKTLDPTIA